MFTFEQVLPLSSYVINCFVQASSSYLSFKSSNQLQTVDSERLFISTHSAYPGRNSRTTVRLIWQLAGSASGPLLLRTSYLASVPPPILLISLYPYTRRRPALHTPLSMNFFKTKAKTPPDLVRGLRDAINRLESGPPGGETRRKVRLECSAKLPGAGSTWM